MIAQVGNYDYQIDWIFGQNGTVKVDVGLTAIDVARAVTGTSLADQSGDATEYGTLVAPHLVAVNHSHHFNFRLDLDIDGKDNSFLLGNLTKKKVTDSPRRSVWMLEERLLQRERQATLDDRESMWKVINPARTNALGYPTGYILASDGNGEPLMDPSDYRRAAFIAHDLWVTAYAKDERYASGDTPNQHPGTPGLPVYQSDNEPLADTDIVLWHNLTFHHVPFAEDYPVLSREHAAFELRPANFFDRNPALDLRRAPFEGE